MNEQRVVYLIVATEHKLDADHFSLAVLHGRGAHLIDLTEHFLKAAAHRVVVEVRLQHRDQGVL